MADASLFRGPLVEQYRPGTWSEVVGQDKVVQRIQALAKHGSELNSSGARIVLTPG